MSILFATNNSNKAREVAQILGTDVKTLRDMNITDDIVEDGDTFEANALIKARFLYNKYHVSCIADDSGLEVDALGGAPGVLSARYAGEHGNDAANNALLLRNMEGVEKRTARFRCAIAYIDSEGREFTFSGAVEGVILNGLKGNGGFGYDPMFAPDEYPESSFAELSAEQKNAISHRGRALQKLKKLF